MWGTRWNNPVSSFIGSSIYWKTMTQKPRRSPSSPDRAAAAKPSGNPASLTFNRSDKPMTTVRLSRSFSRVETEQKELAEAFNQFLDVFNNQIVTGSDRFNVASAAAFFMVSNYLVATGREVPDSQLDALRDALAHNLVRHEPYTRFSNLQRQELYEHLVIFSLLARYGYQEGMEKKDKGQMDRYREFARESLKAVLGVEPDKMVFTDRGLSFEG
jgi:hypothetical protein